MLKARNKKKFRQEPNSEIRLYESAVKYLKAQYPDSRFPTMKALKEERDRLTVQKQAQTDTWHYFRRLSERVADSLRKCGQHPRPGTDKST